MATVAGGASRVKLALLTTQKESGNALGADDENEYKYLRGFDGFFGDFGDRCERVTLDFNAEMKSFLRNKGKKTVYTAEDASDREALALLEARFDRERRGGVAADGGGGGSAILPAADENYYLDLKAQLQDRISEAGVSGVILPGNFYNMVAPGVNPSPYRRIVQTVLWDIVKERQMPTLAVCGGMQGIAHAEGAELLADVERFTGVPHASKCADEVAHDLHIAPESAHGRAVVAAGLGAAGATHLMAAVNSCHSQGIKRSPASVAALAAAGIFVAGVDAKEGDKEEMPGLSEDRIIEAMEAKRKDGASWLIATQYHPEFSIEGTFSGRLMADYLEQCERYAEAEMAMEAVVAASAASAVPPACQLDDVALRTAGITKSVVVSVSA